MAAVRLWGKFWDFSQREFGGLYNCAKFGWNRVSRFDNTKVWIFCTFGLKTPIPARFWLFLGKNTAEWNFLHCYLTRNAMTRNGHQKKQIVYKKKSVLRSSLGMRAKFGVTKKDRIGKLISARCTGLYVTSRAKNHASVIFHAYAATPPMRRSFWVLACGESSPPRNFLLIGSGVLGFWSPEILLSL